MNNLKCKLETITLKKTYVGSEVQYSVSGNFRNVISYRGFDIVGAVVESTRIYDTSIVVLGYNPSSVNNFPEILNIDIIRFLGTSFIR